MSRAHPAVLQIRWQIYAHARQWQAALDIASALAHPSLASFRLIRGLPLIVQHHRSPVPLPKLLRRLRQPLPQLLRPSRAHASREESAVLADSCPGLGMSDAHTRSGL
jgi:hypothetical protein